MTDPDFGGWEPAEHVLPDLVPLVVPIDSVHPMSKETNPQRGDVPGIAASLAQFKQHIPIVVRRSDSVILKGNNTWEAAHDELGWPGIAVVWTDDDDDEAIGRMLSDNFTSQRAHQDKDVLAAVLPEVLDVYPETFEVLGYDEYEMAALEEVTERDEVAPQTHGYVPPVLVTQPGETEESTSVHTGSHSTEPPRLQAPEGIDQRAAVVTGATATGQAGAKALVQYTIAFDDSSQQSRWYAFLRYLRGDPALDGDTIAARLIEFIEAHAEF